MYRFWNLIVRYLIKRHNRHPSPLTYKLMRLALGKRQNISPLYK